jgi:ADP-ribose pyrophosphatase YjhB (NUDIX family)
MSLDWFDIAKRLKVISQAGKTFAADDFELKRHLDIEEICAEILAEYTDADKDHALAILQADTGYPTPKVDSRGAIFRDGKILLVKEIEDGGWTLPGGWCDVGMTPAENVVREVWEESGFEVEVVKLACVYDRDRQGHTPPYPYNIYKLFFICQITGGTATTSNETSEVKFFDLDEIPDLSLARTLPKQIARMYEHKNNPALPTDFD